MLFLTGQILKWALKDYHSVRLVTIWWQQLDDKYPEIL